MKRGWAMSAAMAACALVVSCGDQEDRVSDVRIAVQTDLADTRSWSKPIAQGTGVEVDFSTSMESYDGLWLEDVGVDAKQVALQHGQQSRTRIPIWRVGLVLKRSAGERLGWCADNGEKNEARVPWQVIANKAGDGGLRFGMPNPNYSGVGAAVVYAMHVGTLGKEPDMLSVNSQAARAFGNGHLLSGPSASWVAETYLTKQDALDGVFLPEPAIEDLAKADRLIEPLCVVWPEEAVPVATYTLVLTNGANKDAFDKVTAYIGKEMAIKTRDAANGIAKGSAVATPEWGESKILQLMVRSYLELHMRKGVVAILIDTSSGMAQKRRLDSVKAALTGMAKGDKGGDRFSRFRNNEKLVLVSYPDRLHAPRELYIDRRATDPAAELHAYLSNLKTGAAPGDVSSAIGETYSMVREQYSNSEHRRASLVVIAALGSDTGASQQQLTDWVKENAAGMLDVPVFVLALDANAETPAVMALSQVARASGGNIWGVKSERLEEALLKTRGYQ